MAARTLLILLSLLSLTATAPASASLRYQTPAAPNTVYLPLVLQGARGTSAATTPTLAPATPTSPPVPATPAPTGTADPGASPMVARVIELTNQQRAANGCQAPLRASDQLTRAAYAHSQDMALRDYFSHTSPEGTGPAQRISATGYTARAWAENIAAGYSTAEAVVNGWMNSSGHRANILNCSLTEIGVGYYYLQNDTGQKNYRHYWTQDFATPR